MLIDDSEEIYIHAYEDDLVPISKHDFILFFFGAYLMVTFFFFASIIERQLWVWREWDG